MLHVTGGGSRKLHGLKKDHVHWTQVSGAASAATRAHPEEATAADAFPPKTASTDGDGDLFLLVGSFFSFARARFSFATTTTFAPLSFAATTPFAPLSFPALPPPLPLLSFDCPLVRIYPQQHSPPEHPCHHLPACVRLNPSRRRRRCRHRR